MKICMAQYYTSNLTHGPFAEDINRAYAQKNGYDYYVEKDDEKINHTLTLDENGWKSDVKLHPTWYKPFLILKIFEDLNPDHVLFLDTDAIVSGVDKKIEDCVYEEYDLIAPDDLSEHSTLNAGVFLIRNCDWSKRLLKKWISLSRNLKPEEIRGLSFPESQKNNSSFFSNGLWMDQSALTYMHVNLDEVRERIKILPGHFFNARDYSDSDGSFIFHAYAHGHVKNRTLDDVHKIIFSSEDKTTESKNLLERIQKIEKELSCLKKEISNKETITEEVNELTNLNLIVYHIFCTGNYLDVVRNQIERLKSSGLYDWCDKLEVTCINVDEDFKCTEALFEGMDKVNFNKFVKNEYEYQPITKAWEYSQKNSGKVLYFHSKGVSNQYKTFESKEPSEWKIKGVNFWKELMEHFLIDNYQHCLSKLDSYDQCGLTLNNKWWWGNFWWANLSWLKDNPKPSGGSRWVFEDWINNKRTPRAYEWHHFDWNPYYTYLPLKMFTDPKESYEVEVKKAFYGSIGEQQDEGRKLSERKVVDVTDKVLENFEKNESKSINLFVNNSLSKEDPHPFFVKNLEIHLSIDKEDFILTGMENYPCEIKFPPIKKIKKNKIALACCLFFEDVVPEPTVQKYNTCLEFLLRSAKKFFLTDNEVDFIVLTNNQLVKCNLDYVNVVRVSHDIFNNFHGYAMKVLGLEFIPDKLNYSHIFSTDVDQIFINPIDSNDLLEKDFVLTRHFYTPDFSSSLSSFTDFIKTSVKNEEREWVMGNFLGGKTQLVMDMVESSKKIHSELFGKKLMKVCNFYTSFPEELFAGKYVYENKINHQHLSSRVNFQDNPNEEIFLGDFNQFAENHEGVNLSEFKNVKCLHNTKYDLDFLEKFSNLYF